MPRSRVGSLLVVAAALAILVCLSASVAACVGPAAARTASEPPPTSTPESPGIAIARANFDLPDPFLVGSRGTYYMYLSTAFGTYGLNIPMLTGRPGKFSHLRDALPNLPPWAEQASAGGTTWAPTVYRLAGRYVMYFSSGIVGSDPVQHCIGIATSATLAGPFVPGSQPFICQRNEGGDIDAQVFVDPQGPDGRAHPYYLIWKSDNNSTPGTGIPLIWSAPLAADGLQLTGAPTQIYGPTLPWEQSLIEAPQMVRAPDGRIWLFFSAGQGYFSPNYGMGVASCGTPLGPCTDIASGPLITTNAQGAGPGEETLYTARDGSTWILYSPWHTGIPERWFRPVEAVKIGFSDTNPYVADARSFPPPG